MLIILIVAVAATALVPAYLALIIVAGVAAVIFLVRNLDFGLLVLVFFFPYLGLVIDFGQFEIFRDTVYLKNINAPFVDLFGLLLFGAWGIYLIKNLKFKIKNGEAHNKNFTFYILHFTFLRHLPHWKSYFLFWLSGLVSLWKVPAVYFGASLKYLARPFTFAYLVFFAMPVSILTRGTKHNHPASPSPGPRPPSPRGRGEGEGQRGGGLLHRVLLVFFWTGLLSAFNGLLGLLFGAHEAFPRATPFGFFGINPLGPNHNLLAETLIATAPAGILLSSQFTVHSSQYRWLRFGMFFMWAIALLTFARTAWIAVAVQGVIFLWLTRRKHPLIPSLKRRGKLTVLTIAVLLAVLFAILVGTTFTDIVRGSTLSRLDQARIAAFYFERAPILGQGIGTFVPTLWGTRAYLLEYGEPLEAHGILFKLAFEQGLFGLAAFGVFAGAILLGLYRTYRTHRTNRTYGIALIAALMIAAGSLAYQLFNTTYYTAKLWVPLAIAVGIGRIMSESRSNKSEYSHTIRT